MDATFITIIVLVCAGGAGALGYLAASRRRGGDEARSLADTLARVETQIRDIEMNRQREMGGIESQLSAMSRETIGLSKALRGPNARGRWGELTLRRVAELSGMSPHCDFVEQTTSDRKRPDMLVKLPGGRILPVDAKAPLSAYLEAEEAPDAAARNAAMDRHAQQLKRHISTLAEREYWSQFETAPEMVVLFLPGEHFLSAALDRDRELLESALLKKVLIATPVTLVSVLRGIAYGWRQERLAKNAEELRKIAGEFHERVRTFAESYADAGRHLSRAVEAYNRSAGSWDARMLPSLQRMRELGIGGSNELPQPGRVDVAARTPRIPDAAEPELPTQ